MSVSTRRRYNGPELDQVMAVLHRDGYRCVRCLAPIQGDRGVDWSLQHRLPRGRGGDNSLANLISLCGSGTTGCHGYVESRRTEAYDKGWSVKTGLDPVMEPCLVERESRLVWLGVDGRYHDNPPDGAA